MKKFIMVVAESIGGAVILGVFIAIVLVLFKPGFADDIYDNPYTRYVARMLLIKSGAVIDFNSEGSGEEISSSTANQLDIDASTEIELTTITVDLNGGLDVSDSLTVGASGTPVWKIVKDTDLLIITGADTFVVDSVRAK